MPKGFLSVVGDDGEVRSGIQRDKERLDLNNRIGLDAIVTLSLFLNGYA